MFRQLFIVMGEVRVCSGKANVRRATGEQCCLCLKAFGAFRRPYRIDELFGKTRVVTFCTSTATSKSDTRVQKVKTREVIMKWKPSMGLGQFHFQTNKQADVSLGVLLGGILGLFGFHDSDDEGKVPLSVKRELLKAQRALLNGDHHTAEVCYHQALLVLGSSELSSSQAFIEARAVTIDKLANMYLEQGMYHEAEANFKETMRLMLTAGMDEENEAMIEISLKLSKIYTNQKRFTEAGIGFQWSADTARKRWQDNNTDEGQALLGMCLQAQAKYLSLVGDLERALVTYSEALDIAKDVYGSQSLQYATLLNDHATAYVDKQDMSAAEVLLTRSLQILESLESTKETMSHMAVTNYNLAMVLAVKGLKNPKVEEHIKRSISLLESLKDGKSEDHLALCYFKLATVLADQGKKPEASVLYSKARQLALKAGHMETLLRDIEEARQNTKH